MTYSTMMGWTAESLGPTSGHWKRRPQENRAEEVWDQSSPTELEVLNTSKAKRKSPTPLKELDSNTLVMKLNKGSQPQKAQGKENSATNGDDCDAAPQSPMSLLAWNCRGLGSPLMVRILTDEVKSKQPILVFLVETKASINEMEGFHNKIEYTEGITVPSDGKSGGLEMIWRKGTEVRLKSCSNSHRCGGAG